MLSVQERHGMRQYHVNGVDYLGRKPRHPGIVLPALNPSIPIKVVDENQLLRVVATEPPHISSSLIRVIPQTIARVQQKIGGHTGLVTPTVPNKTRIAVIPGEGVGWDHQVFEGIQPARMPREPALRRKLCVAS
eukprot:2934077-Rhodomonas_salina.2